MDEQIDDYIEPHPEDQAVEAAEAEDAVKAPKSRKKAAPKPEQNTRTMLARANVLAKLANAGR